MRFRLCTAVSHAKWLQKEKRLIGTAPSAVVPGFSVYGHLQQTASSYQDVIRNQPGGEVEEEVVAGSIKIATALGELDLSLHF